MKKILSTLILISALALAQSGPFDLSYDAEEWDRVIEQNRQQEYEERHGPSALPPGIELSDYRMIREGNSYRVIGQIANDSEYTFGTVMVRVTIMDGAGRLLDTDTDHIYNLPPGKIWVFETTFLEDSAADFRITQVEVK